MKNRIGLFKWRKADTKGIQQHKSNGDSSQRNLSERICTGLIGASLSSFLLFSSFFSFSVFGLEVQTDWEYVEQGYYDFPIPARGSRYFHRRLGTQHRIVFDWRTEGDMTVFFLIADGSWNKVMPPAENQIEIMGKGKKMENFQWEPPKEGEWYFIFNNDNAGHCFVSLEVTIFKKLGSPDIQDDWSMKSPIPEYKGFPPLSNGLIIIIGASIVVGVSLGYKYYPRSTPTGKTKRVMTAQKRKEKRRRK
jgi:hypothetical protein